MKKRMLSNLLVLCMMMALLPARVFAAEPTSGTCGKNLTWIFQNDILTISGTGNMDSYATQETPWRNIRDNITSVEVKDGVTSIGQAAFFRCSNLENVTLPESIIDIDKYAFEHCVNLTDITLPENITRIADSAFLCCAKLTEITIPNSVTSIEDSAFHHCTSLESINIPESVTSIGDFTFADCPNLSDVTIPGSVTEVGYSAFSDCNSLSSAGPLGGAYNLKFGWTDEIPERAFSRSSLTSVTISDGIVSIGKNAFSECKSLTDISIPNSVTSIGYGVFDACSNLPGVTLPDSVTIIEDYAFCRCSALTSVTIPGNVTSIGNDAFDRCSNLTAIQVADANQTFTSLDGVVFTRDMNKLVAYPSGKQGAYTIPDGVTHIGYHAFNASDVLTSVDIPDSITTIGTHAFSYCSGLTNVVIPDSVTSIEDSVFSYCDSLTSVTISSGVTSIGRWVFSHCGNLAEIQVADKNQVYTSVDGILFTRALDKLVAYPGGRQGAYAVPNSVTSLAEGAFEACVGLTSVTIPNGISRIEDLTFLYCSGLTSVTISDSVTSIGYRAFDDCDNLTDVYYTGNETQWKAIALGAVNEPLTSANIHYNSTDPDDVGSDNMNPVYFLSGWDATTQTVQFGDNTMSAPITYTVADGVDVSNIDSLLNKYVLVTMEQGDSSLEYTITDIQPVESKIGTVSATGEHSLTIDGTTYPVREDYVLALYDGNEVLYHVYNGTIMGCDVLEEKTGTIEVWNGATGNITIDGTVYSTNYLSDLSFVSNIENYLNKQYYFITVKTGNYTLLYKISERYYPGGKLEDFNADIYHATWLSKHGNAADMLEGKTPSEILIDVVSDGHGDLAMDMWRSLNLVFETLDDVDNLREFAVEPRDLYSALILEALEASASCDVVASEYEEALGIFKRCISDFSTFVKMDTGIDLNNSDEFQDIVSRMPGVDVDAYTEKFIQDWYKTNYPNIADISKSLGYISKGLKVVGTLEDFTEYCAQCITLMRVSDSMKYVLELACLKSAEIYGPTDNMTQAFNDCLQMITRSSDELFDQIEKKAVSVVGWAGYKYLVSEVLWKEVSKQIQIACPEIAILKLIYKAENTICNKLFKTEDAAEKYLKMDGIVNIESIINTVYRDLEFAFDRTPTLEGAKRYLSAMELSFRLRNVDCKTSNEYVENIQSSLVGSIKELLGAADYESLKQCINSIQSEYATHYTLAETGWVPYLEEDYPGSGLYELYSALYETILDSGADVKLIKQITAACPVNVYIYDQQDNIVASIVESRVSCSVNDVMIALLGEEKIIRFYNGADYHIEYVGYDIGEMDVTITEFDENEKTTRTVNYYDLKLTEGKTYAVDANNETLKPYDLLDKSNNSTVQHDYDSMDTNNSHTLKIISGTLQQGGELFTETIASKGETLQIDAYVSEGDEFVRWEASSVNALIADTTSTNTTLIMPDEDLIVTAIMRETSSPSTLHTVTFNPNGGTVDVSIAVTASNGKLSTLPIPILAGHAFDGWYTASSGGEKITTDYVFTSDTTVYAHWTKNSGGSSGGSSSDGNSSGGGSSSASYSITTGNFAHGSVSVSPKSASKGTKVTITATPDTGYKLEKLAVTDNTGNELELTNKGDGTYTFIMPAGTVKVEASFVAIETAEAPWVNPFTDVAENAWYYNAVRFVSENGLMGGYGNGLFGVNDNLSRAQLAQILYNKEGKPLVNDGNGFSDVDTGAWYANAVTWAAANGIVSGYGNGMFGPNNPITREQLAVMLWRYSGSPAATNKELHFNDAEEISGYALEALRWAVENGILNGYGDGRLGPQGQATRAQVAQMLKNYLER